MLDQVGHDSKMASTYALPVAAMQHSHMHSHSYGHPPPRSLSPSKLGPNAHRSANSTTHLRQELPSGPLSAQPVPDFSYGRESYRSHSHSPERYRPSYALPTPPTTGGLFSGVSITGENKAEDLHHSHSHGHDHIHSNMGDSGAYTHSHGDHDHHHHDHDHHEHHTHSHNHSHTRVEKRSKLTNFLLERTQAWTLLQSILLEKDSRRIFYFMSLNFAFMIVQATYGFLTDSLGLLSDSIHMFFDCLALALGLFAAVASKWPPSERFPYGFGKIETLSGFGNGVFLVLISIEIVFEAIERLAEGQETKRLTELFIVSSLGLIVNLIGMACFGHHHHGGHDHSHGGHDHSHSHSHDHKDHDHDHDTHSHAHHGHSHENENMTGIFLHVLADTLGSASVIVSTIFIHFTGWGGWDPIASCFIAILILLSSFPLITRCSKRLLLTIPDDTEYQLRNTLAGVSGLRGVASYSVPRFWMADTASERADEKVLGVMHVIATRGSDRDDVRERVRAYLSNSGIDVVIQVDREGEAKCWCLGDGSRSPSTSGYS